MNQEQRAKWECTRAKGLWYFVLLYGVLCWGGVMAIAMSFISRINLIITIPIYLVTGFGVGLAWWFIAEYRYRKSSSKISTS